MLSKHIAFRCLRQFFWRKLNEMFILFADGGGALTLIYKQSDRDEKRENRASGGQHGGEAQKNLGNAAIFV